MNSKKLESAIAGAQRFIKDAKALKEKLKSGSVDRIISGTKLSGQVRRSSMDLTRSLSDLRKPG